MENRPNKSDFNGLLSFGHMGNVIFDSMFLERNYFSDVRFAKKIPHKNPLHRHFYKITEIF